MVPCWLSGAVFVLCLFSQVTGSNPVRAIIVFKRFSFNFFLQVFCKSWLGLVLALRFVLRLRWALITATKIVVGVVFDATRK